MEDILTQEFHCIDCYCSYFARKYLNDTDNYNANRFSFPKGISKIILSYSEKLYNICTIDINKDRTSYKTKRIILSNDKKHLKTTNRYNSVFNICDENNIKYSLFEGIHCFRLYFKPINIESKLF